MQTILLTWWTWYIWSHWAVELLELWYNVVIIDNLSNSEKIVLEKIKQITNKSPKFYQWDLRDETILETIFSENNIDIVIHFAWAKAVWESCEIPFFYYENNIVWSINLFKIMEKYNCKNIIFSSSATVYDSIEKSPLNENNQTWNTSNPYWTTKFIIENILKDLANHKWFKIVNLRYFNPIWAHKSWLIWENPSWLPNNLLPYIMKVVVWELENVWIFWNDYDTKDWTWERDYIHVVDLINWHIASIDFIKKYVEKKWFFEVFNLWTGNSTSVLEIINITKEITNKDISYKILKRRAWDLDKSYCNPKKAQDILNWKAKYSIKEAIKDSYNFIKNNK